MLSGFGEQCPEHTSPHLANCAAFTFLPADHRVRLTAKHAQDLKPFEKPKLELEQYPTSAFIAARIISYCQEQHDDVTGESARAVSE